MNQKQSPFHLSASSAESEPVESNHDLPAEVSGQPATYFWKEMIHQGQYTHPVQGYELSVDADRLGAWAKTGNEMLAAGVAIPINCDHSNRAKDVVGYVKQFKIDGQSLMGLCQFIGEESALTAARNLVSIGVDPNFTDGQAHNWGEAIVHLALTPVPVVPNQGEFVVADSGSPITPSPGTPGEGGGEGQTPAVDKGNSTKQFTASPHPNPLPEYRAREQESDSFRTELSAAKAKIIELSARLPPDIGPDAELAMIESATAKFDLSVQRGTLTPASRDRLIKVLVRGDDGRANILALSRAANSRGDRALAHAVADILLENQPIPIGESTNLQALHRSIPGEDSGPIEQLRQYMTKVASVG